MSIYNKRVWLNDIKCDSTGSVVAYDGTEMYKGKPVEDRFLEVADCRGKVRLRQETDDTKDDFINKMKLLKTEIELFIIYLEQPPKP